MNDPRILELRQGELIRLLEETLPQLADAIALLGEDSERTIAVRRGGEEVSVQVFAARLKDALKSGLRRLS